MHTKGTKLGQWNAYLRVDVTTDVLTRPGAVKIAEKQWQPASIELEKIHGIECFKPGQCITVLEAKKYRTYREALAQAHTLMVDEQVAEMDAAFAKLETIEASYRKHFGPIPPVTSR